MIYFTKDALRIVKQKFFFLVLADGSKAILYKQDKSKAQEALKKEKYKLEFSYISWFNPFDWSANITIGDTVEIKVDNTIHKETHGSAVWVKLFEKAFAAYISKNCISSTSCFRHLLMPPYDDVAEGKIDIRKILSGGFPCFCRAAVTGIPEEHIKELSLNLCDKKISVEELFRSCSNNHIPLTFSITDEKTYINPVTGEVENISSNHAYSLLRYDTLNKYIYFRNPYEGNKEMVILLDNFYESISGFIFGLKQFDKQKEHFE